MDDPPSSMAMRMAGVSNGDGMNKGCKGIQLSEK